MTTNIGGHEPVLVNQVIANLIPPIALPISWRVFVDCTVGRAGHALAIAERLSPGDVLIGLDIDPANLEFASQRLKAAKCAVRLFHANFNQLPEVLSETGYPPVDGILADLGVSTNQLFDEQYGLSFDKRMALDMRLDKRTEKSAADLVNNLSEKDLADLLYGLAQERHSRHIARKIGEARRKLPILTTDRLAEIVRAASPPQHGKGAIHPATRTFLALRMAVNQEVANTTTLVEQGPRFLKPGGRMVVISFQSTEDRIVKQGFRAAEQAGLVRVVTKKPTCPEDEEIAANPRSRSAKLRAIERI
jgi:16S rRNA (cytosine1402-N4)-methyltransferase